MHLRHSLTVLAKAAQAKLLRTNRIRVDTTVVPGGRSRRSDVPPWRANRNRSDTAALHRHRQVTK